MLKRYQVLITEWQEKHIKSANKRYDLSDSTIIRTHISLAILYGAQLLYPEYKIDILQKELCDLFKKSGNGEATEEEIHQMMAKIQLEARKIVEGLFSKESKKR